MNKENKTIKKNNILKMHQESGFKFPDEIYNFIQEKKDKRSNLITVLHRVQSFYGFIPGEAVLKLSQEMRVSLAKIYGIVTFYHFFKIHKPAKITIKVCMGTACYLKGAKDLILELKNLLNIGANETSTKDQSFAIETVRCVGCCGLAPVIIIGEDTYGSVTTDKLPGILAKYKTSNKVTQDICDEI